MFLRESEGGLGSSPRAPSRPSALRLTAARLLRFAGKDVAKLSPVGRKFSSEEVLPLTMPPSRRSHVNSGSGSVSIETGL